MCTHGHTNLHVRSISRGLIEWKLYARPTPVNGIQPECAMKAGFREQDTAASQSTAIEFQIAGLSKYMNLHWQPERACQTCVEEAVDTATIAEALFRLM